MKISTRGGRTIDHFGPLKTLADSVAEEVLDANAESEDKFFRSEDGAFVRFVEERSHSLGERLENSNRVSEEAETEDERIQMTQHLGTS